MKKIVLLYFGILAAIPAYPQLNQVKLVPLDTALVSYFGYSLAVDMDYLVVGAPFDYTCYLTGLGWGSAYIFKQTSNSWVQEQKLLASDCAPGGFFGNSVDIDGDYLIVGAPSSTAFSTGYAYIFKFEGSSWYEKAILTPNDGINGMDFGHSVSIDGEYAIIGAPYDDDNGNESGSAYIFKRNGDNWTELIKLIASNGFSNDHFGNSVAISGDYAFVGAEDYNLNGGVFVYRRIGNNWVEIQKFESSLGVGLGSSVALENSYGIAGAKLEFGNELWSGAAYIYHRPDSLWEQQARIIASDGESGDFFGQSSAIDENFALVGAPFDNDNGTFSGSAYLFQRSDTIWSEQFKLTPSDADSLQFFGHSVDIYNNQFVVGAYSNDRGAVYIFNATAPVESPRIYFYNTTYISISGKPFLLAQSPPGGGIGDPVKICADGSNEATLVAFAATFNTIGVNDIDLIIQEDPTGANPEIYGSFDLFYSDVDSIVFRYNHPRLLNTGALFKEIHLLVVDQSNNNTVLYEYPLEIYRTPVITVHGLWADRSSFSDLITHLVQSNQWPKQLTYQIDYKKSNDRSFHTNEQAVSSNIAGFVLDIIKFQHYSVGKVSVVAHSMGGILTRYYLQSNGYRGDINRIITLNTPHSGSQMANFLLDHLSIANSLNTIGYNPFNGAVLDLRVNSTAILVDLNGMNLNRHVVPSHVVTTNITASNEINPLMTYLIKQIIGEYAIPVADLLISAIFNSDINDLVVADSSQTAGISNLSRIPGQGHVGSAANFGVINLVDALLNTDPNNTTWFTTAGYNPYILNYNFPIQPKLARDPSIHVASNSITINSPPTGSNYTPGDVVNVDVSGSSGINKILFAAGNAALPVHSELLDGTSAIFNYQIPNEAIGQINMLAIGYGDSGYVDLDSIHINVSVNADLDSITLYPEQIYLFEGDTGSVAVTGYYNDGISRDLSYYPVVMYESINIGIATFVEPGLIAGVSADTTLAYVFLEEDTAFVEVIVLPPDIFVGINPPGKDTSSEWLLPHNFVLFQNYPNPFNSNTIIQYNLKEAFVVTLTIYSILGQRIKTLVANRQPKGQHQVIWDGTDDFGNTVGSGIYFYQLSTDGKFAQSKKMLFLK